MSMISHIAHAQLVKRAQRWLEIQGCGVVITELTTAARETPNAIGWHGNRSFVIECKVSRSDYYRDKNKALHRTELGGAFGNRRYYMTPPGLLVVKNLPEHWGLLEVHEKSVTVVKPCVDVYEFDRMPEVLLLTSALRRMVRPGVQGISCKTYTFGAREQGRAEIGVQEAISTVENL